MSKTPTMRLDRLLSNFGKPYLEAYGGGKAAPAAR